MADSQATGEVTWSVTTANPLEEIEVAVTRVDPENRVNAPFRFEQALPLRVALAAFTVGSATSTTTRAAGRCRSATELTSRSSTTTFHPQRRTSVRHLHRHVRHERPRRHDRHERPRRL